MMPARANRPQAECIGCGRRPSEILEYGAQVQIEPWDFNVNTGEPIWVGRHAEFAKNWSAEDYVWEYEGTLNTDNGHFVCDTCFVKMGQPSSPTTMCVAP